MIDPHSVDPLPTNLPPAKPETAGRGRAILWAIVALVAVGLAGGWFWLRPEQREELREEAAQAIDGALEGTPLAGVGQILRESPPPPPPAVTNPPTASGTLAGRQVTGTLGAPVELPDGYAANPPVWASAGPQEAASQASLSDQSPASMTSQPDAAQNPPGQAAPVGIQPATEGEDGRLTFSQEPVTPPSDDPRVTPSFLAGVADWLANRYRPGPKGGSLAVSVQSLNHLCGVTLAPRADGGRAGLLRYVLQPSMIDGLYKLYIDRFMVDLDNAARKKAFSEQQNKGFHLAVAGRAVLMASALEGVLAVPDLEARLDRIDSLGQKAVDANADLATVTFEMDELRNSNASQQQLATTQLRVDGITARYRRALSDYENARRDLAATIRRHAGQSLDEDSLLYMSEWVERRLKGDPSGKAALERCAAIFRDLARRCAQAGA